MPDYQGRNKKVLAICLVKQNRPRIHPVQFVHYFPNMTQDVNYLSIFRPPTLARQFYFSFFFFTCRSSLGFYTLHVSSQYPWNKVLVLLSLLVSKVTFSRKNFWPVLGDCGAQNFRYACFQTTKSDRRVARVFIRIGNRPRCSGIWLCRRGDAFTTLGYWWPRLRPHLWSHNWS